MRQTLLLIAFALVIGCAPAEDEVYVDDPSVEPEVEATSFAGTWSVDALPAEGDSVLVTVSIIATDSSEGWSTVFDHIEEPVLANSVVIEGDSAIIESGPFPSAVREGVTVLSLTSVIYAYGDDLTGHFTATYESGDPAVSEGRLRGTRSE